MPASPLPTCPSPDEVPLLPLLLSSSCRRRVFGDNQWQQCWRLPGWAALQVASLTAPVRHCLLTPPTLPASPSLFPSPVFALVPSLIFFLGHFATGAHSHDRQLGGGEFSTTLTQEPVPGTAKMAAVNNTRRLYVVPCSQVDFTVYFAFLCYLLCILFFFPIVFPHLSTHLVGFVPSSLLYQRLPGWFMSANQASTLQGFRSPVCAWLYECH